MENEKDFGDSDVGSYDDGLGYWRKLLATKHRHLQGERNDIQSLFWNMFIQSHCLNIYN